MNHIVQEMYLESEKKNSFRYDAMPAERDPPLTAIYVSKKKIGGNAPSRIRVTITEAE